MKEFNNFLNEYIIKKDRSRRYFAILTALSLLVTFIVPSALIEPAVSQTKSALNGNIITIAHKADGEETNTKKMVSNANGGVTGNDGNSPGQLSEVELLTGNAEWAQGLNSAKEATAKAREIYLLGIAHDFSVFIEGDYHPNDSDTEGRAAIGGNIEFTGGYNYQFGNGDYENGIVLNKTDNYIGRSNFAQLITNGTIKKVATLSQGKKSGDTAYYTDDVYKRLVVNGDLNDCFHYYWTSDDPTEVPYQAEEHSHDSYKPNELAQIYQGELINFADEFEWLRNRSVEISKVTGRAPTQNDGTKLILDGPGVDADVDVVYFTVPEWVNYTEEIHFTNIPQKTLPDGSIKYANIIVNCPSDSVIISAHDRTVEENVSDKVTAKKIKGYTLTKINGTIISNDYGDDGQGHDRNNDKASENILYNFYNASKVEINSNFNGTILSPNADVISRPKGSGHLSGALIAKSFEGGLEFGYRPYRGTVDILGATTGYVVPFDKFIEGSENRLPNAMFLITDENNKVVGSFTTGSDTVLSRIPSKIDYSGKTEYNNGNCILTGNYKIAEKIAPDGYILDSDTYYNVTVTETIDLNSLVETCKEVKVTGENGENSEISKGTIPKHVTTNISIQKVENDVESGEHKTIDVEMMDQYTFDTASCCYKLHKRTLKISDNEQYYIDLDSNGNVTSVNKVNGSTPVGTDVVVQATVAISSVSKREYNTVVTQTDANNQPVYNSETVYRYDNPPSESHDIKEIVWNDENTANVTVEQVVFYHATIDSEPTTFSNISFSGSNYWYPFKSNEQEIPTQSDVYRIDLKGVKGSGTSKFQVQGTDDSKYFCGDGLSITLTSEGQDISVGDTNFDPSTATKISEVINTPVTEEIITAVFIPITTIESSTSTYYIYDEEPLLDGDAAKNKTTFTSTVDGENRAYSPKDIMVMPYPTGGAPSFVNRTELMFIKADDNGNPLRGANIVFEESSDGINFISVNSSVFNWNEETSSSISIDPAKLGENKVYRFREAAAPENYETADPIYLIKERNTSIYYTKDASKVNGTSTTDWTHLDLSEPGNGIITMTDIRKSGAKVKISKVDFDHSETFLRGAKFDLYAADGTAVATGLEVTNAAAGIDLFDKLRYVNNKYVKHGYLQPGTYYLSETDAPSGYDGATEPLYFKVKDNGDGTYSVEKADAPIPVPADQPTYKIKDIAWNSEGNPNISKVIFYYKDGSSQEISNVSATGSDYWYTFQLGNLNKEDVVGVEVHTTGSGTGKIRIRKDDSSSTVIWQDDNLTTGQYNFGFNPNGSSGGESGGGSSDPEIPADAVLSINQHSNNQQFAQLGDCILDGSNKVPLKNVTSFTVQLKNPSNGPKIYATDVTIEGKSSFTDLNNDNVFSKTYTFDSPKDITKLEIADYNNNLEITYLEIKTSDHEYKFGTKKEQQEFAGYTVNKLYFNAQDTPEYVKITYYYSGGKESVSEFVTINSNNTTVDLDEQKNVIGVRVAVQSNSKNTHNLDIKNGDNTIWSKSNENGDAHRYTYSMGTCPDLDGHEFDSFPNGKNIKRIVWRGQKKPEYAVVTYIYDGGTTETSTISDPDTWQGQNSCWYLDVTKSNVTGVKVAFKTDDYNNAQMHVLSDTNNNYNDNDALKRKDIASKGDNKYLALFGDATEASNDFEGFTESSGGNDGGVTVKYLICLGTNDTKPQTVTITYYISNNSNPVTKTFDDTYTPAGFYSHHAYGDNEINNVVGARATINYGSDQGDGVNFALTLDDYSSNFLITKTSQSQNDGVYTVEFGECPVVNPQNLPFGLRARQLKAASMYTVFPQTMRFFDDGDEGGDEDTTSEELDIHIEISITESDDYSVISVPNKKAGSTVKIAVEKKWEDTGYESFRPESITVQLKCDGEDVAGDDGTKVLSEENGWKVSWSNLNRYKDNTLDSGTEQGQKDHPSNLHTYSVVEVIDNDKYEASYSRDSFTSNGTLTITNTLKTTDVSVVKQWVGSDGTTPLTGDGYSYPASISVQLQYKNGENEWVDIPGKTFNLTADSWSAEAEGLPAGYTYRFVETSSPAGWIKVGDGVSDENGIIRNKLDAGSLGLKKLWQAPDGTAMIGNESNLPASVSVSIYRKVDTGLSDAPITPVEAKSVYEDYGRLLQYSLFMYDANMCGDDVGENSALNWREDCHSNSDKGYSSMVSGGYHDAGDHVMFGLPQGFTASTLGWTFFEYSNSFNSLGITDHYKAILEHFCDFFVASTTVDESGDVTKFLYQKGTGGTDHGNWITPENQRKDQFGDEYYAEGDNKPGDIAADYAAALALYTLNFPDDSKNETYLNVAKALYKKSVESWNNHNKYAGIDGFYYDVNGSFADEQAWAAAWLYLATGDSKYKTACAEKLNGKVIHNLGHYWGDVTLGAEIVYNTYIADEPNWNKVETYLDSKCQMEYKYNDGQRDKKYLYLDPWGNTRHNTLTQLAALTYCKNTGNLATSSNTDYETWAEQQMNYILGDNKVSSNGNPSTCFVVGFAENSAQHPQHRAAASANGDWNAYGDRRIVGAMVAGDGWTDTPINTLTDGASSHNNQNYINYIDSSGDYVSNEVALDYNAGLVGAAAALFYYNHTGIPENNDTTGISSKKLSDFGVTNYKSSTAGTSTPYSSYAKTASVSSVDTDLNVTIDIAKNPLDTVVMNIGQTAAISFVNNGTPVDGWSVTSISNVTYDSDNKTLKANEATENGATITIRNDSNSETKIVRLNVQLNAYAPDTDGMTRVKSDVTITKANDWSATVNDLPIQDSYGRKYKYYVVENIEGSALSYIPIDISVNGIELDKTDDNNVAITNRLKEVEDEPITLPSAGGDGTRNYYVFGAFLLVLGAGALIFKRRRTAE